MINYTGDAILLGTTRTSGGTPTTGLTGTVRVVNARTDAVLLATTSLVEAGTPGEYRYIWSAAVPTVATDCLAVYTLGGRIYFESFRVDDIRDRIDNADGRAT